MKIVTGLGAESSASVLSFCVLALCAFAPLRYSRFLFG